MNCITKVLQEEFIDFVSETDPTDVDCFYRLIYLEDLLNTILAETEKLKKGLDYLDLNPPPRGTKMNIVDVLKSKDIITDDFTYFLSFGFPPKARVMASYYDDIKRKQIRGLIEFRNLKQREQAQYIMYNINQYLPLLHDGKYYFWLEKCKSEEMHFHGLVNRKTNIKDIKLMYHKVFNIDMNERFFVKALKFDRAKWSNYHIKTKKDYEYYDHKPITNMLDTINL